MKIQLLDYEVGILALCRYEKKGGGMEDRSRLSAIPTSIVGLLNNHEHPNIFQTQLIC